MHRNKFPKVAINPGIPTLPKNLFLGRSINSDVEWIPSQAGHILVSGSPGSGKTVFMQNLAEQCRLKNWLVIAVDGKSDSKDNWLSDRNIDTVSSIDETVKLLHEILSIMKSRFSLMDQERVNNHAELKQPLFPILVVIDGIDHLLNSDDVDPHVYPEDLYTNQLKTLLFSIMRIGRAAGIHFAVSHTKSIRYSTDRSNVENVSTLIDPILESFSVQIVTDANCLNKDDILFGKAIPSLPSALDRGWVSFFDRDSEIKMYEPVA